MWNPLTSTNCIETVLCTTAGGNCGGSCWRPASHQETNIMMTDAMRPKQRPTRKLSLIRENMQHTQLEGPGADLVSFAQISHKFALSNPAHLDEESPGLCVSIQKYVHLAFHSPTLCSLERNKIPVRPDAHMHAHTHTTGPTHPILG